MGYYGEKQRACSIFDSTIKGCKAYPIDGLILKIENLTGLGEKFVRERLERMSRMNHIIIDREKDEVTWND